MGYSTQYTIDVGPFESEEAAEFFEFKVSKEINESFSTGIGVSTDDEHAGSYFLTLKSEDTRWYEWREDLTGLSQKFPDVTIDVVGTGEEAGDMWKARFRDGKSEVVDAEFIFPDFQELV